MIPMQMEAAPSKTGFSVGLVKRMPPKATVRPKMAAESSRKMMGMAGALDSRMVLMSLCLFNRFLQLLEGDAPGVTNRR
jgi:hypothetical protein